MSGTGYVLLISEDGTLVDEVRGALGAMPAVRPLAIMKTADRLSAEMLAGIEIVLIHVGDGRVSGPVGRLLWLNSTIRRPIPVLAVVDDYRAPQALTFFRMGVSDVLSRRHHLDRLGELMPASGLRPSPDRRTIDRAAARVGSHPYLPIASQAC
jgi:hypothetical protein